MSRTLHRGPNERRLRGWLLVFFVALSIPIALLVVRASAQMKWEVFHQWRLAAEELTVRIDTDVRALLAREEARSFGDYAFLTVAGDPGATYLQRSPLSAYPVDSELPGIVGYFQVDRAGKLSSPLVPEAGTPYADYGVSEAEYRARAALNDRLGQILGSVGTAIELRAESPAAETAGRPGPSGIAAAEDSADVAASANVFDRLSKSLGSVSREAAVVRDYARLDEFDLDQRREQKSRQHSPGVQSGAALAPKRESRKEQVASLELAEEAVEPEPLESFDLQAAPAPAAEERFAVDMPAAAAVRGRTKKADLAPRVRFFDGEIDPFTFSVLDAEHFVLFRNVWREGERFIQGAVIERDRFIDGLVVRAFRGTALERMSRLLVAYDGSVIRESDTGAGEPRAGERDGLRGELLYRARLSAPFAVIELLYTVTELPPGPGARYLTWVGVVLALVLVGGFFVLYRYGIGQITLFRQQQDFVSAVSHELKTPLTSIRMYSEILLAGWADEKKKAGYYRFIHDESERLSRLIANVLQLSRMTRGNHTVELKTLPVRELLDVSRSKISSQLEAAGFELALDADDDVLDMHIAADADAFAQIMINLVDNAIKFCPAGAKKQVAVTCRRERDDAVCFAVRDFGAGIPKDQMRKIFDLFYRPESELTRETVGTGIGLALVHSLTEAMGGRIDVRNRDPGAEFRLVFPRA